MSKEALSEHLRRKHLQSLMYPFSEDYIQTLGVNFMEKVISIRNTEINFTVSSIAGECPRHVTHNVG